MYGAIGSGGSANSFLHSLLYTLEIFNLKNTA
jgi:hypothetical protein